MTGELGQAERNLILDVIFRRKEACCEADLNWDDLVSEAIRHGVAPLLCEALREKAACPSQIQKRLQAAYYSTASGNMRRLQAAGELLKIFAAKGIRALPLKGAVLAERVYGNIALRPFEDVDILIKRSDYAEARTIFEGAGFESPGYLWPDQFYLEHHFHLPFVRSKPVPLYFELHWDFTDRFMLFTPDMEGMLHRAGETLAAEDEWIYLAMHLSKHGHLNSAMCKMNIDDASAFIFNPISDNRLIWFCDLWRLAQGHSHAIDWTVVRERAARWGALEAVGTCARILEALSETSMPADLARMPMPRTTWMERKMYQTAVNPAGCLAGLLRMHPALQFRPIRLLALLRYTFPPTDYLKRRYRCLSAARLRLLRLSHPFRIFFLEVLRPCATMVCAAVLRICKKPACQPGGNGATIAPPANKDTPS